MLNVAIIIFDIIIINIPIDYILIIIGILYVILLLLLS